MNQCFEDFCLSNCMFKIICSICVTADPDFIQRSVILKGFIILRNTQITTAVVTLRINKVIVQTLIRCFLLLITNSGHLGIFKIQLYDVWLCNIFHYQ